MATRRQRSIPRVEWAAGIVSLLIVLGTVGYLAYEGLVPGPDAPSLSVTVMRVRESDGSFVVDVAVRNSGRSAASDVHLAATARSPQADEARAQARLDYVPGLSTRHASFVFAFDPGKQAEVRVIGYAEP